VISSNIEMMEANTMAAGLEPGPANPQPFSAGMSLVPSFDVIELLPPGAADRLRALRQRFHDTNVIIPKFETIREASDARIQAEARLRRLLDHQSAGGFHLDPTDSRVIEQQRLLDKLTDDFRRLNELNETRSAAWRAASHVMTAVETRLKDGGVPPGVMLQDHEVEVPKLNKGETITDAIERYRRRGRELKADLHRIQSAPYPSSYAKAQMRAQIEALAQQGAPNVANLIEHDRPVEFATRMVRIDVRNTETASVGLAEVPDTVALFAWLHRDALVKRLDAEIDGEADDAAALTHEARQKAEAVVMGDLMSVERDESALVWQAQAQNLPVEHRSDCAPAAILQVQLMTTAPRTNGSGTSPEHVITFGGRR
jgi:hypothetical protein